MRLRRIENELNQKKVAIAYHRLEEEFVHNLEHGNYALDASDSGSEDGAPLSIRS